MIKKNQKKFNKYENYDIIKQQKLKIIITEQSIIANNIIIKSIEDISNCIKALSKITNFSFLYFKNNELNDDNIF